MRRVDTNVYVSMLRDLVNEGKECRLLISGSSMAPFLVHERDSILFSKPDRELRRGDMVFYQRDNGQFVMHRILHVKTEGLYIIGDAQTEVEGLVRPEQVFALVTKVNRKGKWIGPGNFWWWFFSTVWLRLFPIRRLILKLYPF